MPQKSGSILSHQRRSTLGQRWTTPVPTKASVRCVLMKGQHALVCDLDRDDEILAAGQRRQPDESYLDAVG